MSLQVKVGIVCGLLAGIAIKYPHETFIGLCMGAIVAILTYRSPY
jgi:hypothetical protein